MSDQERIKQEIIKIMKDNLIENIKLEGYDSVMNNMYLRDEYKKDVEEIFKKVGISINYSNLIEDLKQFAKEYLKECNN